ncbi:hypothetical protein [Metallosphaera sedula]|uniref:hypothetical protein n=1 Tax=Metallosphaera sedula TaxID=43687 RepID=UPI0020BE0F4D|nr:hypothetical protein [Metallosphaera sedula]BBL48339.1 hypothetical protein MJ1HA_2461 [Metallosphaera sedula]
MNESLNSTIPPPKVGENTFVSMAHVVYQAYYFLVQLIAHVLQATLFQQDPALATQYATLISWLIPLTAIYLILVFATSLKKVIGYAIAAGWGFILLMLILSKVG